MFSHTASWIPGFLLYKTGALHEVLTTFFRDDEASTKVRREPTGHDGLQGLHSPPREIL